MHPESSGTGSLHTQVIHLYLDENEQKPDDREDLRPNGFTRESAFHNFPIRGQEVLLHVRRLMPQGLVNDTKAFVFRKL